LSANSKSYDNELQNLPLALHANTPTDIDTVLNALPAGTCVEGYATAGDELFITVSHYDPYRKEIAREIDRIDLRAKK
jgi:hypothetical protein